MPDPHPQPDRPDRPDRRGVEGPSEELVLLAVERAMLHQQPRSSRAVPLWAILEHLAVGARSREARSVRATLTSLHAGGELARSRRHGVPTWELTGAARTRLRRARAAGGVPALPESPQHRAWRRARTAAGQEIERFRQTLRECLKDAARVLAVAPPAGSDAWFELGDSLQRACWRLGSATHCLYEWAEPSEERADPDDRLEPGDELLEPKARAACLARRAGRRNVTLWGAGPRV